MNILLFNREAWTVSLFLLEHISLTLFSFPLLGSFSLSFPFAPFPLVALTYLSCLDVLKAIQTKQKGTLLRLEGK